MHALITNDDSHRSPLLGWLIRYLSQRMDITVVVPAEEQSWRAKSMSRFTPVLAERIELAGIQAYAVTGTPADCVNLGVYQLCPQKPDLVVSGINAGLNAGSAFMLSSGTVGACLEGNVAGIPGIALSQAFDSATMRHYIAEYALPAEVLTHLESQTERLLPLVFNHFLKRSALLRSDTTWNVNFPFQACADRLELTRVGRSWYGSCFSLRGGEYVFDLSEVRPGTESDADAVALSRGIVSVSPVRPFSIGDLLPGDREAFV